MKDAEIHRAIFALEKLQTPSDLMHKLSKAWLEMVFILSFNLSFFLFVGVLIANGSI